MEGQETVHSVCGPLTHSVKGRYDILLKDYFNAFSDMRLFMTSVLAQEPWKYDSKVIPMPWRQIEADAIKAKLVSGGLTLGFYDCDGVVSLPPYTQNSLIPLGPPTSSHSPRSRNSPFRSEESRAQCFPLDTLQARLCGGPHQRNLRVRRRNRRLRHTQRVWRAPNPQLRCSTQPVSPQNRHERALGHPSEKMGLPI